jgi:hypothetical protein
MRYRQARPSLKVTRHTEEPPANRFTFEVWNPFLRSYQPVASVEDGVLRVGELANLISRMRTRQHPKLALLEDVPEADLIDRTCWAELRINPTIPRSCYTRRDDHPAWTQTGGLVQATQIVCARVGCAPHTVGASGHSAGVSRPIAQDRGMHG